MHPLGIAVASVLGLFGILKVKEKLDSVPRAGDVAQVPIMNLGLPVDPRVPVGISNVSAMLKGTTSGLTLASVRITGIRKGEVNNIDGIALAPGLPAEIPVFFSRKDINTLSRNGKAV